MSTRPTSSTRTDWLLFLELAASPLSGCPPLLCVTSVSFPVLAWPLPHCAHPSKIASTLFLPSITSFQPTASSCSVRKEDPGLTLPSHAFPRRPAAVLLSNS